MDGRIAAKSNEELVNSLRETGAFHSNEVHRVLCAIDRADFSADAPYFDAPQGIGFGSTISAPHMASHATALEAVIDIINPSSHVLDVGSGSGYLTACFAKLLGPDGLAVGVEHIPELVELSTKNARKHNADLLDSGRLRFVCGDGRNGFPEAAPFDVIHVGAGATEVPKILVDQLAVGGRLICPVGPDTNQEFLAIEKSADGSIQQRTIAHVVFIPLTDREKQWGHSFY